MTKKTFNKILSANDVGSTGGHQAGVLIPKSEELLAFLPNLDPSVKNPDAWIECEDEDGILHKFRFVYYNNKLHDKDGTRNEYRITHMTKYFREAGASEGDSFEISKDKGRYYRIRVLPAAPKIASSLTDDQPIRIRITSSWSRVH